jgi:hypothetical protein
MTAAMTAVVAAGTIAVVGVTLGVGASQSLADTIGGTPAHQPAGQTTWVQLAPMPHGTVRLDRDGAGVVDATVSAFGLTPGSAHAVDLVNRNGQLVDSLGTLTAGSAGQVTATLGTGRRHVQGGWRVVILNGTAGDPVSAEPIARTQRLHSGRHGYGLTPVEVSPDGVRYGTPQGWAKVTYDPGARTISVTVNASGLTPGAHAAHIHVGSCAAQGAVQYMLMDFSASAAGRIVDQTRTVTNVTAPPPASGWYLNLHQGNSNNILANGSPTINFRPLLCGDITARD